VLGDHPGHLERLVAALDGAGPRDQREVIAAHLAAVDVDHRPLALAELSRGELVRLQDRHQMVDPRRPLEPEAGDPVAVAYSPDYGQELPLRQVGGASHRLHSVDDRADLLLGRPFFHHDHHLVLSLSESR
jgi:hypothetical protein